MSAEVWDVLGLVVFGVLYTVVALLWMRYWYGRARAHSIDAYPSLGAEYFERNERGMAMTNAVWAGLFWWFSMPMVGITWWLQRWLASTPIVSQAEREAQYEAMERRIRVLEIEKQTWEARNQ